MSSPYIGEIKIFAGNFAPLGWAFCSGQLLAISQNDVLFNLIGTTYGGDGQNTFALPDLRGRVPIHQGTVSGNTYMLAEKAGAESVTIVTTQLPVHNHTMNCNSGDANSSNPANNYLASQPALLQYGPTGSNVNLKANAVNNTGGNLPHENMIPFVGMSYIISLFGVFPSQN